MIALDMYASGKSPCQIRSSDCGYIVAHFRLHLIDSLLLESAHAGKVSSNVSCFQLNDACVIEAAFLKSSKNLLRFR